MQHELSPAGSFTILTHPLPAGHAALKGQTPGDYVPVVDIKTFVTPVLRHPLEKPVNLALKRIIDVFISLLVTALLLCWLIPLIALLIKADSRGPVFFLQKRNKRRGNQFWCIKFRSMVANADADILPAGKNDRRITRVGRFLRRHYLDELPQFINVLLGDMSVIGPRPHMVNENLKFDGLIKNYCGRHKVKPGITGLAQVMGYEGEITDLQKMKGRVSMDVFYIRHWSLRMDMAILYRTLGKTLGL
jgi:putative colanic acid biosysnthesis UDP-glucose lipid carrier transferase